MAREAGFVFDMTEPRIFVRYFPQDGFDRLVTLVRADERNRTWTQEHWTEYERSIANQAVMTEQKRIVNLLMIQHEAAKGTHNYWHVAANLIQADVTSDT
jgi:hypothetical protein